MSSRVSNQYAPEDTCPYCGFKGQDWGFKYHRSCTKCYNKWRKENAAELKKLHPNENIEIAENLVITTNVEKKLIKIANSEVPYTPLHKISDWVSYIGFIIAISPLLYLIFFGQQSFGAISFIGIIFGFIVFWVAAYISGKEERKRRPLIQKHLEVLARERQKQIDEMKRFYGSPEWRLEREKVIRSGKNICKNCGKKIDNKYDITVDHILPRSKYPHKALEMKNLQVLCRSCNSSKGNRILEQINLEELE